MIKQWTMVYCWQSSRQLKTPKVSSKYIFPFKINNLILITDLWSISANDSLSAFQRIIEWDGMDFLPWFLWTSTKDPHSVLCASFNVASAISPFFCIALLSFRYQSDSHCESHNWIIPSAITFQLIKRDFHVTFCSLPVTRNLCS